MHGALRVQLIALCVLLASLVGSAALTVRLASSAGRHQLTYTGKAEDGMSRDEAVGIALGAFRGLFVNWLWLRANELKEAGKYHEAVDLSRTITRLQPRYPRVWAFHAWNLAYNISVATNTAAERWQWVSAGIRLLRDEGIPANPADLLLHKELAWIFLHKVQGVMDDANQYYKRAFAREWTIVLGPPPQRTKETRELGAAINAHVQWLTKVATAKDTLDEIVTAVPVAQTLIDRLRDEAGLDVRQQAGRLEVLRTIEMTRSAFKRMEAFGVDGRIPDDLNPKLIALLGDAALRPGWEQLAPHFRKRTLIDTYHMEPERMIAYTREFGPIDWRHPSTHSLYWARRGVQEALKRLNERNVRDLDFVNTDRIVLQSLQSLFRSGQVMYDILAPETYAQIPSADFIWSYRASIQELMEREAKQMAEKGADMRKRVFTFYAAAYENFISDAIGFLYRRGQKEDALRLKLELATWEGRNLNDLEQQRLREHATLEEFILANVKERATNPDLARLEVYASLAGAYINGLLTGDEELFRTQFAYAELMHKTYTDEQVKRTSVDPGRGRMEEMDRDFRIESSKAFVRMAEILGPFDAAIMYQRTPSDLRMAIYYLLDRGQFIPLNPDGSPASPELAKMYPTPPDYLAYRAIRDKQEEVKRAGQQATPGLK